MDQKQVLQRIEDEIIICGMRGPFVPAVALELVEVMMSEGIRIFEFTMNSEEPIEAMQAVKARWGDAVVAGMGTVLDVPTAHRVLSAGADFVVSPAFQPAVVEAVLEREVFMAPGVMTPSEAITAWDMGVPMLKIFPIGSLGLDYFKAIFGPLNHLRFMCNGGMNAENAGSFIRAGAKAVGMAGWLSGDGTWTAEVLRDRARQLRQAIGQVQKA